MFKGMFGCLFILIFGFIFVILGVIKMFYQLFFNKQQAPFGQQRSNTNGNNQKTSDKRQTSQHNYTSGNAHNENANPNSRQRRSGKMFEKGEGEYVDFEEV